MTAREPAERWLRSMLFVPGHKTRWLPSALAASADAVIVDLEDAVPEPDKARARESVALAVEAAARDGGCPVFVRVNGVQSPHFEADLGAVVPGVAGVLLAKCGRPEDVSVLDAALTDLERARGEPVGATEIVPLCETALGIYNAYAICRTSARVQRLVGVCNWPAGGDTQADLLYEVDDDGLEPPWLSTRLIVDGRAAGVRNLLAGPPMELCEPERLSRHARRAKALGANGGMAIHPDQVALINATFTPSDVEIRHALHVREAMTSALARGDAATRLDGEMIDAAHLRSSEALLAYAARLGVDVNGFVA